MVEAVGRIITLPHAIKVTCLICHRSDQIGGIAHDGQPSHIRIGGDKCIGRLKLLGVITGQTVSGDAGGCHAGDEVCLCRSVRPIATPLAVEIAPLIIVEAEIQEPDGAFAHVKSIDECSIVKRE